LNDFNNKTIGMSKSFGFKPRYERTEFVDSNKIEKVLRKLINNDDESEIDDLERKDEK